MKNIVSKIITLDKIIIILLLFTLTNCGVSIKSVVDNDSTKEPYKNILIAIPFENVTKNFVNNFSKEFSIHFTQNNKKSKTILFEQSNNSLKLNKNKDIDEEINSSINEDNKDLVIFFKPSNLTFYNGGLQSLTYEIVAIETVSNKEIWKARFNSNSSFGPALFAKKSSCSLILKVLK